MNRAHSLQFRQRLLGARAAGGAVHPVNANVDLFFHLILAFMSYLNDMILEKPCLTSGNSRICVPLSPPGRPGRPNLFPISLPFEAKKIQAIILRSSL
jgi:hypothetical protein